MNPHGQGSFSFIFIYLLINKTHPGTANNTTIVRLASKALHQLKTNSNKIYTIDETEKYSKEKDQEKPPLETGILTLCEFEH